MKLPRSIKRILRPYYKKIAAISLVSIVEVAASLVFVWFSKCLIDVATGRMSGSFLTYALLLVGVLLVQIVSRLLVIRLRNSTEVRVANTLREKVFEHLLYTKWHKLERMHSGDILTKMIKDVDDLSSVLVTAIPLAISAFLQLLGAFILLAYMDIRLAVIIAVVVPGFAMLSKAFYMRMRAYTKGVKERESSISTLINEVIRNQLIIRTFEHQRRSLDSLHEEQTDLRGMVDKRTRVSVFANGMLSMAFNGGYLTAFIWSGVGLMRGSISFGTVTAYLQLVVRLQRPVFDMIRLVPSIIKASTAVERLSELLSHERERRLGDRRIFLEGNVGIVAHSLSFSYSRFDSPVLYHFNLSIPPGSTVAIMGKTGAGKTTLLRLLLGLVKPNDGSIKLYNEEMEIEVSELTRCNFVYVPQGNSLFSGTIRENLLLGNQKASTNHLLEALDIAVADFVHSLPNGMDTLLGEGGVGLSEGQAQRIAIARSLLRPGGILLFDEATSALDMETERQLLRNIQTKLGRKTILFITHHPKVAEICDQIITI